MFRVYRRPTDEPGPGGAGFAFVCALILSALLPLFTSMAIGEWSPRGWHDWEQRLELTLFISLFISLPPLIGWFVTRAYWTICWFWFGSLIMFLAYLPCLAIAAAVPLGWRTIGVSNEMFLSQYAFVFLLICAPLNFGLYRLLTTRYFQPWTKPDQWEAPNYHAPRYSSVVTDIMLPSLKIEREHSQKVFRNRELGHEAPTPTVGAYIIVGVFVAAISVRLIWLVVELF